MASILKVDRSRTFAMNIVWLLTLITQMGPLALKFVPAYITRKR